ncbi:MAG: response regulator transcription factor [Ruminococcus sp.]|nr:response regulator transcription factor [Oscillospiraceae bacterium]MDY4413447.1 response regulator transcription factor [Ruminococcus sp.]
MIWCIEDDKNIRDIEIYTLKSTGFEAVGFSNGRDFFKALDTHIPELIILDIMLPDMDGVEVLKKLKQNSKSSDIPVIMATAKGMEYDKIQSLDLGADDYLVKPFGMMEMVSRIKAVLRRCRTAKENSILKYGTLSVDLEQHVVTLEGERVMLTYKEFELLRLFLTNIGTVFTRDTLFSQIWGEEYIGESRTIDVHIRMLRHKIGKYGEKIETVRNVGYRMEAFEQ